MAANLWPAQQEESSGLPITGGCMLILMDGVSENYIFGPMAFVKHSFVVLFLTVFISSCHQAHQEVMNSHANEQFIEAYFTYFNQHNWEKMAAMYSDTADFKDPSLGQGMVPQTRQQTIEKYAALATQFPDIHDDLLTVYPSGDQHVIVEFVSTGTAPDQSTFTLPVCTIFTIINGKITQDFTYYDNVD